VLHVQISSHSVAYQLFIFASARRARRPAGHSVRASQHGGRALVQQRPGARPHLQHEPRGPARPGATPPGPDGCARPHGYLGFGAFKELAATYHGPGDDGHPLFPEIEALLREVNDAAPAEGAEKMLATDDAAVEAVAKLLRDRKASVAEDGGYVTKQKLHVGPTRPRPRPVPALSRGVSSARRTVMFDEGMLPSGRGVHGRGRGRGRGRR
jgi:hypothetical protein